MGRPSRDEAPRSEAIVAAARKVFLQDGYGATSIDAVVKEAGVSKATFYRHFTDKDAVLTAVLKEATGEAWAKASPAELLRGSASEALTAFCHGLLRPLLKPGTVRFFRLVIAEAERFPQLSRAFFEATTAPMLEVLAGFLAERSKSGELRELEPTLAALQLLGLVKETLFWPRLLGAKPVAASEEAVVARAVEVFLAAYLRGR